MSYIPDRKIVELTKQINEARNLFEQAVAERDQLRQDLAAARSVLFEWQAAHRIAVDRATKAEADLAATRALLRDCLPELDGEGTTIHRAWAALAKEPK